MRKLASVQIVESINPIEGADRIEQACVLGWSCIVGKGEFKPGDRCIFFEIDAMLPETPAFEFMRKHKFRVKSVRMKGVLAQGLALPLSKFPELKAHPMLPVEHVVEVGDDVTDLLGVKKFEIPEDAGSTGGLIAGPFPGFIPKTDELRVQSYPAILDELRGVECYVTVKMDGSSCTIAHRDGDVYVCGRNAQFKESDSNAMWKAAKKYNLVEKIRSAGNYAVQGEVCGPKIQGNRAKLPDVHFFAFNVFDIKAGRYLSAREFFDFCVSRDIPTVPLLKQGFILNHTLDELLELAKGNYDGTSHPREGIVIRPAEERLSKVLGGRASFKVINNDFLLATDG